MKKILSVFIAVLVLISCFSFCTVASAAEIKMFDEYGESANINPNAVITFSDDYKTLYLDDEAYSRYVADNLRLDASYSVQNRVLLTDAQNEEIDEVTLTASENGEMFYVDIYFSDGAEFYVSYLQEDYISEYKAMMENDYDKCQIIFYMPENEDLTVDTTKTLLSGEKTELAVNNVFLIDFFSVYTRSKKLGFLVEKGSLLEYKDDYYFVDYAENGLDIDTFDPNMFVGTAYKVTDPDLISEIEDASLRYYSDSDYGIFFSDNFTKNISKAFIILLFVAMPFVTLVLTLIFGFRAKKIYKKLFFTTAALCLVELLTVAIIWIVV